MLEYERLKQLSKKMVNRASEEIEKDMMNKNTCDLQDVQILSMAIDNIKDLMGIEGMKEMAKDYKDYKSDSTSYTRNVSGGKTEFDSLVEDIIDSKGREKGINSIMMLMSDVMEDLSVLQPKIYDNVITKMKALK